MHCDDDQKGGQCLTRFLLLLSLALLIFIWTVPVNGIVWRLAIIFAAAVTVVSVTAPLVILAARRLGAVDIPGGRHWHDVPTPKLGGLPIWLGVMTALLLTSMHYMPNLKALVIGSSLMLFIGLLDDLFDVPAVLRLLVQAGACVILIADGVHVTFLPATWWGVAGEWLITAVWILGITNAVNFLDGIDGLVAGLSFGTCLMYFMLSMLLASPMLAYCSVALIGAALAFLGYNVKPARLFLGDGGSSFLGFFLAALSIQGEWARHDPLVSFFIPVLLLSVPIYDMVFTTVARIASGKVYSFKTWIEYTGRDHLHHRLTALGLTRGQVTWCICFLNLAVGFGAITLFEARTYGGVALILQAICVYMIIALLEILGRRKPRAD
jgi:UDP-GlcNAc:undecaprenyl-phosphate GlcNAc-1-phosphate transferase